MNILVINCGSSSLKFQLIDMSSKSVKANGLVERIGLDMGKIKYETTEKHTKEMQFKDHSDALNQVAEMLQDKEIGVIKDVNEIDACGHRAVHGGEEFSASALVNDNVMASLKKCIPLAPLHNPANITGIEVASKIFPKAKHVCVFDTAFHQTMPSIAFKYAIPDKFYKENKVRKYGFHGTSHLFVTKAAASMLNKDLDTCNIITVHVGNGASVAAIENGKCIDTTMGMTPLAGLVMGTRCGDIDPAIPYFLCKENNLSIEEVDRILNKESGMLGLTGYSDLRDIEEKYMANDPVCTEAMKLYIYSIKKHIGAFYAALGRVDAIVFTAGVGENSDIVRKEVCENMESLGISIDVLENGIRRSSAREISDADSKVKVFIIPTNEELEIAEQTVEVLKNN